MKAVTMKSLQEKAGKDNARALYMRIAKLGKYGTDLGDFEGGLPPLDLSGLSEAKQRQVEEWLEAAASESAAAESAEKKSTKKEGNK